MKVRCTYFKESGKYYCDSTEEGEWTEFPDGMFVSCIYPSQIGRRLRELEKLPGLVNGTWNGPFTITVEGKYTELVLPY